MHYFVEINWIAVLIGTVFNMALGALWYGPLFGKLWRKIVQMEQEDLQSSAVMYLLPLVMALISSYILAVLIEGLAITVWWQGLVIGVVIWLGIGSTAVFTTGTFENSSRGAWLLFTLYYLVVFAVEGVVFAVWKL